MSTVRPWYDINLGHGYIQLDQPYNTVYLNCIMLNYHIHSTRYLLGKDLWQLGNLE
jgi:hypothetical protein